MTAPNRLESFNGRQMAEYLIREWDAVLNRQAGSHRRYTVTINGQDITVPCPDDDGTADRNLVSRVASDLGLTPSALRAAIQGQPLSRHGKIRNRAPQRKVDRVTRNDVVTALDALQSDIDAIRSTVASGIRDPEHYRQALNRIAGARRALQEDDAA